MDIYPGKMDRLLYEGGSELQEIRVFEKLNGFRYLTLNGVQHGGHIPGSPGRLVLPYFRCSIAALAFIDRPKDYLLIGLGMGAMPSFLRTVQPEAGIDVAEIDPGVVEAAKAWFGFREDEGLKVHVGDGREFVRSAKKKYDAVFLDAYRDLAVPSHLTTLEFMREVRSVLAPGGVVVSNLWGSVVNPLFNSCVGTLQTAFPEIYQFKSYTYNYIIVADTKEGEVLPGELLSRAKGVMSRMELGFDLVELVRRQYARATGQDFHGEVLHD